uniref:Secreted protein n=1 Tax=uncultured organism TaxID=155900 RepID=M1Q0Q2_9ZZZZ|nr:secreted protein [uncultured organism]
MKVKGKWYLFIGILIVGLLLTSGSTLAQGPSENVDVYGSENDYPEKCNNGRACYTNIQNAVNAVDSSGKIHVKAEEYNENEISISNPLDVIGEDKSTTIIDAGGNQHGFYSRTDSIGIAGFEVTNFLSHAVNLQDGSKSIISNNIIDPGSPALSAIQAFSKVSNVEVSHNKMYGVGIRAYLGSCDNWEITNNTIDIENNAHHGIVGGGSNYLIEYNDIRNSGYPGDAGNHQAIDTYQFGSPSDWMIQYNTIYGNEDGIQIEGSDHEVRFNSIHDNSNAGLIKLDSKIYATLNFWGDPDGPTVDWTDTSEVDYSGGGDKIVGSEDSVFYSPWISGPDVDPDEEGIQIDTNSTLPGVQLPTSVNITVAPVGPKPTTEKGNEGYINQAIWGSNQLEGKDTITVNKGYYTGAEEEVTKPADIKSETCPECSADLTRIDSEVNLGSNDVQLGKKGHGFTITGNVTVSEEVDASSVHINWNDIMEGNVVNKGSGLLDAGYNYWGGRNPEEATSGNVNTEPSFDVSVCAIQGYLENNPTAGPQEANAALVAGNLAPGELTPRERAKIYLSDFGVEEEEAYTFIEDYGAVNINESFENTEDYGSMINSLTGYGFGPAGGAGGMLNKQVAGGAGSYKGSTVAATYDVGETIEVDFNLSDFQGDPVKGEHAVVTVSRLKEGEEEEITTLKPADYEEESYTADIDTEGFMPGHYRIYIDLSNGTSAEMIVKVEG